MAEAAVIVPGPSIPTQPWWPAVHSMVNAAFDVKNHDVFPPTWTRLRADTSQGAQGLAEELGPLGHFIVVFQEGRPVASTGVLPFRGENWINEIRSTESKADSANEGLSTPSSRPEPPFEQQAIQDWEICCFCVHPEHRKRGLSRVLLQAVIDHVKFLGARRLVANYSVEDTGDFWPSVGFTTPIGTGGVLKKGFTPEPGVMEGLRADVHFKMSLKVLE